MKQIIINDRNGNKLDRLYQWDSNQTMVVSGIETNPIPAFHFGNRFSRESITVTPIIVGSNIQVKIPNVLLECPETIIVYAYQDTEDLRDRTIYEYLIPVIPRQMPSDYAYFDNLSPEIIFMSENGTEELFRLPVSSYDNIDEPTLEGLFDMPTKETTLIWDGRIGTETSYTFDGWSISFGGDAVDNPYDSVECDRVLYAHFSKSERIISMPFPDLNRNGYIDEEDASIILTASAAIGLGKGHNLTTDELIMADTNRDGDISSRDAYFLLDFVELVKDGVYDNNPEGWHEYYASTHPGTQYHSVEFYVLDELQVTMVNVPSGGGVEYPLPNPEIEYHTFLYWEPSQLDVSEDISLSAVFETPYDPDNFIYGFSDTDGVAVAYKGTKTTVVVPTEISNSLITGVSAVCFSGSDVGHVVFPDGIVEI